MASKDEVRLPTIYASEDLETRAKAAAKEANVAFTKFGEAALEYYLEHKGVKQEGHFCIQVSPEDAKALVTLATEARFRGNVPLLLEHLAYAALENGRDSTVEFIFRPTDEKFGISRIVDDRLNAITEDDADKKRGEARKKEA